MKREHATQLRFRMGRYSPGGKTHLGLPEATFSLCGRAPDWNEHVGERNLLLFTRDITHPNYCYLCQKVAYRMDRQYGDQP